MARARRPRQSPAVALAGRLHRCAIVFELLSGGGAGRGRRAAWPVIVSTAAHAGVLTAAAIIPLLYATDRLPEVPAMMAFVAAPPPPPPPPPPPAPARPAAEASARALPSAAVHAAPIEAPSSIEAEAAIDRGFEAVPGGVDGGVPGGVVGGIVGGLVGELPPPPPPPAAPRIVRIGGSIQPPALVSQAAPVYPELAVKARVQGTVILEAVVDEDGLVKDVRVLRSIPLLDDAALEAVRRWRYAALRLNGVPQAFMLTVTVSFRIPDTADAR